MKFWQKILNSITFGLYNPEKKFEQEVLGEATTNLEEIQKTEEHVKHHGIAFSKIQAVEYSAGHKRYVRNL